MKPDADAVIKNIVEICEREGVKRVVLFGSRAKGTCTERSDIDIAIEGAVDFLSLQEKLEKIPTLLSIDLINMDKVSDENLFEDMIKCVVDIDRE